MPKRHVEMHKQIGPRITGSMCFLYYVKCTTVKITLEGQLINYEYILS
jgi:hypothetical protein